MPAMELSTLGTPIPSFQKLKSFPYAYSTAAFRSIPATQMNPHLRLNMPSTTGLISGGGHSKRALPFLGPRKPLIITTHKKTHTTVAATFLPIVGPESAHMAEFLFTLGTAFVIPIYMLMILAPHWNWTRKLVGSDIPYIVLGVMYIYLLALSWTSETAKLMFSSKYWLPELPGITRMFSSTLTVASAWIHLLVVDLLAGRQIFFDGLQHAVETRHSLVMCLLVCPIGILLHLVTRTIVLVWRKVNPAKGTAELASMPQ